MPTKKIAVLLSQLLLACLCGSGPCFAASEAIGMIAGSTGTLVSGQASRSNTALFGNDNVLVGDHGLAIVKLLGGGVIVMSKQTSASFSRQGNAVTLRLDHGGLSILEPPAGSPFEVTAGGISVKAVQGLKTKGDITLRDGQLSVRTALGRLRLEGKGVAMEAANGKTITLDTTAGPQQAAASVGRLRGHAGKVASFAAGGGGAAAVSMASGILPGTGAAAPARSVLSAVGRAVERKGNQNPPDDDKNPNAVSHVAAHVPDAACEHAASPSVPAVACAEREQP